MSRIIAIDPGEMTGWAIGRIQDTLIERGIPGAEVPVKELVLEQFGYDPWKVFVMNLANVQEGEDPFGTIVYESWRLRPQNAKQLVGSDFPSSQCIGAIKLAGWRSGAQLVTSEPSNKPVIDRQMGGAEIYLPKRDTVEHYRDAVRHLYWYAVNKEGIDPNDTRQI
jgi:hypothetical protein